MDKKFLVVGIGEILWDMLPQGKVLGGAPANFAYHASELGAHGIVVSAIGKDKLGEEIFSHLSRYDLEVRLQKVDFPTGTVNVKLKDGIPEYEIIKDVAWDNLKLSPSDLMLAGETYAVCFGSLAQRSKTTGKSIEAFISNVPDSSLKIFDINLRQHYFSKEIIDSSLQLANILKINDEELEVVSQLYSLTGTVESRCKWLMDTYHLNILALTCGTQGSYLYSRNDKSFMETPLVDVKDTIGAGDAFTAGMAVGLLKSKTLADSHAIAVEVAAYVCSHDGAMPPYSDHIRGRLY